MNSLRIDSDRFQHNFETLARIGSTAQGGVHRPALSENHLAARRWFRERIAADDLEFRQDPAGNHSAVLPCPHAQAPTLLLGSHLDSVPNGGRFDGALGVLAAYEVLRTIRDAGIRLPFHLEAIDFTDEEGTLVGLLGSRALAGNLPPSELAHPRGGRAALLEGLHRAGLQESEIPRAARPPDSLAGFLELHIEQGPRLLEAGADIGIVTGMVGIGSFLLTFTGRADHAGTTPMHARRDAGLGAAEMIVQSSLAMRSFSDEVINFGHIHFSPGAFNIVPHRAQLTLEYRSPTQTGMDALKSTLTELAHASARKHKLELEIDEQGCVQPTRCSPGIQQAFRQACKRLGLKAVPLPSGAGHDTQALAQVCPAGMIFIPSTGGSHNPEEFAAWPACVNGANVLLHAVLEFANDFAGG